MIFDSDSTLTLDEISRELVQGLSNELSDPRANSTLWTKKVKDRLYQMGEERGMWVCGHGSPHDSEWLLDIIWMVKDRHEIVLAVESEWGNLDAIANDFEKLMPIKARHKLLLFNFAPHEGSRVVGRIVSYLRAYPHHLAGEEYMALNVNEQGAFRYRFQVPSDGSLDAVCFNEMERLPWTWPPR